MKIAAMTQAISVGGAGDGDGHEGAEEPAGAERRPRRDPQQAEEAHLPPLGLADHLGHG